MQGHARVRGSQQVLRAEERGKGVRRRRHLRRARRSLPKPALGRGLCPVPQSEGTAGGMGLGARRPAPQSQHGRGQGALAPRPDVLERLAAWEHTVFVQCTSVAQILVQLAALDSPENPVTFHFGLL